MKEDWDFVKVFRDLDDLTTTIYGYTEQLSFTFQKRAILSRPDFLHKSKLTAMK